MPKVSTNINLDSELKRSAQKLFSDLGLDLTTAVTIFLKQSLKVQGLPFSVTRDNPNAETIAAMNGFYEMQKHSEAYNRYSTFGDAVKEVLPDA